MRQPLWRRLTRAVSLAPLLLPLALFHHGAALSQEGNPFRGRDVFSMKGCSRCHSVWGHGGSLGPDIVPVVLGKSLYELVGDFWNHTPRMMEEVTEQGYQWPTFTSAEMADTLSYLYYLRLFDSPGDPVRGAATYARLLCGDCHSLAGQGGATAGPLDAFGAFVSPTPLAQAMWNAGPRMQAEQLRRSRPIPRFTGAEMADLQAFIRSEGLRPDREVQLQPTPDQARGAAVYRQKRCGACHDGPRAQAPDVGRAGLEHTVAEITGLLWNHSYAMSASMRSQGISVPSFEGTELSDLIAHIYFMGFTGDPGDPATGAQVFEEKGCADCHRGGQEGVPDMATLGLDIDRVGLAASMWNHAPEMHKLMAETSPYWPKFEPGEMRHLAAFLAQQRPAPATTP